MDVEFRAHNWQIDKPHLQDRVQEGTREALGLAGDAVGERARRSLRRSEQVSRPGQPPSVHSQHPRRSLRNILTEVDPGPPAAVYIGPIPLTLSRTRVTTRSSGQSVPELLERGGQVQVVRMRDGRSDRFNRVSDLRMRLLQRSGRLAGVRRRLAHSEDVQLRSTVHRYQARPFMAPALEREAKSGAILDQFRDSVHE